MQIEGWVVVDIEEVFDVKTKSFKVAEMREFRKSRKGDWLGVMRIRCAKYLVSLFHHACAGRTGIGVSSLPIRITCSWRL